MHSKWSHVFKSSKVLELNMRHYVCTNRVTKSSSRWIIQRWTIKYYSLSKCVVARKDMESNQVLSFWHASNSNMHSDLGTFRACYKEASWCWEALCWYGSSFNAFLNFIFCRDEQLHLFLHGHTQDSFCKRSPRTTEAWWLPTKGMTWQYKEFVKAVVATVPLFTKQDIG